MAIDNVIHKIGFTRKRYTIYGKEYTVDTTVINVDTDQLGSDKTHDIIIY